MPELLEFDEIGEKAKNLFQSVLFIAFSLKIGKYQISDKYLDLVILKKKTKVANEVKQWHLRLSEEQMS